MACVISARQKKRFEKRIRRGSTPGGHQGSGLCQAARAGVGPESAIDSAWQLLTGVLAFVVSPRSRDVGIEAATATLKKAGPAGLETGRLASGVSLSPQVAAECVSRGVSLPSW